MRIVTRTIRNLVKNVELDFGNERDVLADFNEIDDLRKEIDTFKPKLLWKDRQSAFQSLKMKLHFLEIPLRKKVH